MNLHPGVATVGGSLVFAGCFALPADFAIQRASKEFHCPPERIGIVQRLDVSDFVYDVDACGQRARYACVWSPADDCMSPMEAPPQCVREPDPPKWDPDPVAIASLPRPSTFAPSIRSTPGEARRVCGDDVDAYADAAYDDGCLVHDGSSGRWRSAKLRTDNSGMTHQ